MAATGTPTPNIGLRIPQGTDPASVDDINYNSNLIDTKLGAVGNDSVQDQINALNSKIYPTNISFTTTENFQFWMNESHYITNRVIHIYARVKVLSIPSTTSALAISFPSGIVATNQGMVSPVMKSSSEWGIPSTPIYCYTAANGLSLHKSDLAVGDYITFDSVLRIN